MWFREVIRSKTGCVVMVVVSDLEREIVESVRVPVVFITFTFVQIHCIPFFRSYGIYTRRD